MERYMALDVGDNTIGVAVSDTLNITAQGVKTIRRISNKKDVNEVLKLISEYSVTTLVVGLPLRLDGTKGIQAEKVEKFIKKICYEKDIEVIYEDERYTTLMAEKQMINNDMRREKRKQLIDMLAAVNILTTFLEKRRK